MPKRCVAINCAHSSAQLYRWPKGDEERATKWTAFVACKRMNWSRSIHSVLCLDHFSEDSFANLPSFKLGFSDRLLLKPDAVPTIHKVIEKEQAPLSTSTPRPASEKRVRRDCRMALRKNQEFESWAEFQQFLNKYSEERHVQFITRGSRTVHAANKQIVEGQRRYDAKLKYSYIRLVCKHYGNMRTRGLGIRAPKR